MDLSYDGSEFHGWASQTDLRTIQGEISTVLNYLTRSRVDIQCAGRTDAGVHARGQVAHLDVTRAQWARLEHPKRLNRALPDDIRVHALVEAPVGFDARFSASWRRYTYRVCDDSTLMNPLLRHQALLHARPLDIDAMNESAQALLGLHDFAAFCKSRDFATTVRSLQSLEWQREGESCVMTIQADAFCRSMIRALVGSMLPVGDGRKDLYWPAEVLAARRHLPGVTVMPPHPLILQEVGYPADGDLAARQAQTRLLRTLDDG